MFEPDYKCKLCKDFSYVHPVVDGSALYDRTIYCRCQGSKAGKTAHPPRSPARLAYMTDYFYAGLNDYLYQSGCGRTTGQLPEPSSSLQPIKDELEIINNRLNEIPIKPRNITKKVSSYD